LHSSENSTNPQSIKNTCGIGDSYIDCNSDNNQGNFSNRNALVNLMTTRSQPQIAGNVLVILNPSKRQKACGIGDSCVESSACDTSHTLMAMQSTSFARVKNFLPIASAVFMVENVLST